MLLLLLNVLLLLSQGSRAWRMSNRTHLLQKVMVAQNSDSQQAISAGLDPRIFGHCSAADAVLHTHRKLAHGSETCLLGLSLDPAQRT